MTAQPRREQTPASPGNSAAGPGRFGLLLVLLTVTYFFSAIVTIHRIEVAQIALFAVAGLLALRNSTLCRRAVRLIVVAAAAGSLVAIILVYTTSAGSGIGLFWIGLLLLLAIAIIVHRVLSFGTVAIQSIYGVLSAYLMLGLMYAAFYAATASLASGPFFATGAANTRTLQYFSFTTLTTLGYGDFTAVGNVGRAIAVLEALTGQIFLATLVARLVAAFRAPADRRQ